MDKGKKKIENKSHLSNTCWVFDQFYSWCFLSISTTAPPMCVCIHTHRRKTNCWQKRKEILGLFLTPEHDASRLLPFQLTSPFAFLWKTLNPAQLNEHLFLLASSCPHWFYGRRTRWWWDPVHSGGCRGPANAEHLQVPFGTGRVLDAPRYSWVCSDFVISLLRYWSHLARVIIWMTPFSLLIECLQVPSWRAFPDPEPRWNAERGEI